jgi:hypothetical protein
MKSSANNFSLEVLCDNVNSWRLVAVPTWEDRTMSKSAWLLALAGVLAAGATVGASGPYGGYLIVDKVILDPADAPTTVQLWGSIILAKDDSGARFTFPQRGYLYYKIPKGKEEICRKEWADLKKSEGKEQVLGFGSSEHRKNLGRIRKADQKPESPDDYPLDNGLIKFDANTDYKPVQGLLGVAAPRSPGDGDLVPPGQVTLVVRNIIDKKHPKARYVFELVGPPNGKATYIEEARVEPGDKETKWTPKLKLEAGKKYTWSVRAKDGKWEGPSVTSRIVVKGGGK